MISGSSTPAFCVLVSEKSAPPPPPFPSGGSAHCVAESLTIAPSLNGPKYPPYQLVVKYSLNIPSTSAHDFACMSVGSHDWVIVFAASVGEAIRAPAAIAAQIP